ncbi:MAG: hypothetical protein KAR07_06005 [Spirochaetes bacterium]|nr:hypothetical protein [Spirochaetota bacterium]
MKIMNVSYCLIVVFLISIVSGCSQSSEKELVVSPLCKYAALPKDTITVYSTNLPDKGYKNSYEALKDVFNVHNGMVYNDSYVDLIGSNVCNISNGMTNIIYSFLSTNIILLDANQRYIAYSQGEGSSVRVINTNGDLIFTGDVQQEGSQAASGYFDLYSPPLIKAYFYNGTSPKLFYLRFKEERNSTGNYKYYYDCEMIDIEQKTTNVIPGVEKVKDIIGISPDNRFLIYNYDDRTTIYFNFFENQGQLAIYDLEKNKNHIIGTNKYPEAVMIGDDVVLGVRNDLRKFYLLLSIKEIIPGYDYAVEEIDISSFNIL